MQLRQRNSELRVVRMTVMSVTAFVLSWSPYCFVSLAAVFTHKPVIASGEAEVPELLAKASVVYNPIVYTIMNNRFRATLLRVLHVRRRGTQVQAFTCAVPSRSQVSLLNISPELRHNNGINANNDNNKVHEGQSHLKVPSAMENRAPRRSIAGQM